MLDGRDSPGLAGGNRSDLWTHVSRTSVHRAICDSADDTGSDSFGCRLAVISERFVDSAFSSTDGPSSRTSSQSNQRALADNGDDGIGISFGSVRCQGQTAGKCHNA